MSARREAQFWWMQRLTAAILALCVFVHLATIIYAVRGGLTAAEVLGRTRGSVVWAIFYATFVIAAALHGAIGLRTIAAEWLGLRGEAADLVATVIAFALTIAGLRAVLAVVVAP